jgi:hypothetical protein
MTITKKKNWTFLYNVNEAMETCQDYMLVNPSIICKCVNINTCNSQCRAYCRMSSSLPENAYMVPLQKVYKCLSLNITIGGWNACQCSEARTAGSRYKSFCSTPYLRDDTMSCLINIIYSFKSIT